MSSTATAPSRSVYLSAIDGIRAFAVAAVLWFHSDHLSGGFLGVDAFFVISGFLITRQMLQEIDRTQRVSLRAFWARRARRILPALLLLLGVVLMVTAAFGLAAERITVRRDAPWVLAFSLNWHQIAASSDYWASAVSPSPFAHLWSLAVEEQFYVIWPLVVVLLVWRRTNPEKRVAIGALIGAALSFAVMALVFDPQHTTRAYEGTDARIGALLIGAACATTIVGDGAERIIAKLGRRLGVVVVVPVAVLAWMWLRVDGRDSWLYHGGFLLHAVLVAAIMLAVSSVAAASWLRSVLSLGPVRWFGQLSYGLYLWHWPIYIALGPAHISMSRWPMTALRIAVTLVVSTLSFYLIEKPIRRGLQHQPLSRTTIASIVSVGLTGLMVIVVPVPDSRPARIDLSTLAVPGSTRTAPTVPATSVPDTSPTTAVTSITTATSDSSAAAATTTTTTTAAADASTVTTAGGTTTTAPPAPLPDLHSVLWLGDSIAFTTAPGIGAALAAVGIAFDDGSYPGVGLLNAVGPQEFENIARDIAAQHPDLVIMQTSTWDEPYGVDAIYAALGKVRDLTSAVGAHLLLIPVPPLRSDQDHSGYVNDSQAAGLLAAADPAHVSYLSTTPFWGPTFTYDFDHDKVPERMNDGVHLCPSGSARFAIWLLTQLGPRYGNIRVADPSTWATGDWTQDPRYSRIPGACGLLP